MIDIGADLQRAFDEGYEKGKADRPQGEWIVSDDKYFHTCQFCNADVDVSMGTGIFVDNEEVSHMNYCPNCGARMSNASNASNTLETLEKGETK